MGVSMIRETGQKRNGSIPSLAVSCDRLGSHFFRSSPGEDFLWAYTFIGPFSYLLWKRRTLVLQFRKWLKKLGLINPKCDYEKLAAILTLEQTQAIHYYGRTKDHK